MNSYLILYTTGATHEIEADFYQAEGGNYVFMTSRGQVLRVSIESVTSVTKVR